MKHLKSFNENIIDSQRMNKTHPFEELRLMMQRIKEEESITSELDYEEDGTTCDVGFEITNSYVNAQMELEDEDPYLVTAGDPHVPTLNETYCSNLEEVESTVKGFIESYN